MPSEPPEAALNQGFRAISCLGSETELQTSQFPLLSALLYGEDLLDQS
jgi:hypothetical protein